MYVIIQELISDFLRFSIYTNCLVAIAQYHLIFFFYIVAWLSWVLQ